MLVGVTQSLEMCSNCQQCIIGALIHVHFGQGGVGEEAQQDGANYHQVAGELQGQTQGGSTEGEYDPDRGNVINKDLFEKCFVI